jgi:hypothetical protein
MVICGNRKGTQKKYQEDGVKSRVGKLAKLLEIYNYHKEEVM